MKSNDQISLDDECNCRIPSSCPLDGHCLAKNIIYQATIESNNTQKVYIGSTQGQFKTRYANHKTSIKYATKRNTTRLSQHYWNLKDKDKHVEPIIKWKILERCGPENNGLICNLCTTEKLHILQNISNNDILNSRRELATQCVHRHKTKLKKIS